MLLLFIGCIGGTKGEVETNEHIDEGLLCWASDGALIIDFQQCLSSSCDDLLSAECTVTEEGDLLVVHGSAVIESQVGGECTDDCGFVEATCTLPEAEDPSQVRVRYAGQDLPMEEIPDCFW